MENEDAALKLADELVSCQLPEDNDRLKEIVNQCQRHNHRKSCLKYNGICRYGFPRLPSPMTLLAKPLEDTHPNMTEKEKAKKKKRVKEVLTAAKNLLEDPGFDENMAIKDFYEAIDTNETEYLELLKISERGKILVLKRGLKERNRRNFARNCSLTAQARSLCLTCLSRT